MSEYTPSLDEARDRYADARAGVGEWTRFDDSVLRAVEDAYAEFDRWLADHDAKVRAEALREAADAIKPPEVEPESPYSYDPWEDESIDQDNTYEVVRAAVSRGWDRGAYIARVGIHWQLLDMAGGEPS